MSHNEGIDLLRLRIESEAWMIGEAILKGILLEVSSYPKPGLVSSVSMGAHSDMNILTFMVSSAAICPAFYLCAQAGKDHREALPSLSPKLREIGVYYEQRLLESTKGINTQRGILFAGGILCGAAGFLAQQKTQGEPEKLFSAVSEMTRGLVARELEQMKKSKKEKLTAGEGLYLKYGAKGIRGEVEEGFPSVRNKGLPAFKEAAERGACLNDCLVHTLIALMTCVEDTTILWRKGLGALFETQRSAMQIIERGSIFSSEGKKRIAALDRELIEENISPGGSADLLAITAGIYLLNMPRLSVPLL